VSAHLTGLCAEDQSNTEVSATLRLRMQTVGTWRERFVAQRLEVLLDEPRPGAPRQISDEQAIFFRESINPRRPVRPPGELAATYFLP
jgi:transposase